MRVRFAPSPTGTLHIGSARTALFNFLHARHCGGVFVVRSEDTDAARSEARHEASILADLRWLGLEWDEGPDVGGPYAPYRQSERRESYQEAAARLLSSGHAYHCFCSDERLEALRAESLGAGRMPRYDRRCRRLSTDEVASRIAAGEPAAIRLEVPAGEVGVDDLIRGPMSFHSDSLGDFIIVRSDGMASYNFAAAVDDVAMCITHVIRGDDHMTNTARQLLVLRALAVPGEQQPRYAHHSLILGAEGGKLSKRHGATAVGDYRASGYLPEAVVNYLALLSWSHGEDEVLAMPRLVAEFELEALSASPAVFDLDKLAWLDHQWIMASPRDEHERRVAERLPGATAAPAIAALAAALKPSLRTYGEVPALTAPVLERPALDAEQLAAVAEAAAPLAAFRRLYAAAVAATPATTSAATPAAALSAMPAATPPADFLDPDAARELLSAYRHEGKQLGLGARQVLMPLRIALTGQEHGPELHFVLAALSRAEVLARLDGAATAPPSTSTTAPAPPGDQGDRP